MLLLAVQTLPTVETIEQKFLETGHTHMEVDGMHATIDCHKKKLKISAPSEWSVVLQTARRGHPYVVREMEQHEFYDLHKLSKSLKATNLAKAIQWMKVKCVRVTKGVTDAVEVKESYSDNYHRVFIRTDSGQTRKTRNRAVSTAVSTDSSTTVVDESLLKRAYTHSLPVSVAKKADLLKLCASGVIKSHFHAFYHNLTTSANVKDSLPEPDCSEYVECDADQ